MKKSVERNRAWRRAQADRKFRQVLAWRKRQIDRSYVFGLHRLGYLNIFNDAWVFRYEKRTSRSEAIEVAVVTESHMRDYVAFSAKKLCNTTKPCSCYCCSTERKQGLGNTGIVLSQSERSFLMKYVYDIADLGLATNSKWRKRKYKKSTHKV